MVMPIPRPVTGHEVDSYKIMLSIAGESCNGSTDHSAPRRHSRRCTIQRRHAKYCCLAGDRLYTHWLKLIGNGARTIPMLEVELTRAGNDIKSVAAQARRWTRLLRRCRIACFLDMWSGCTALTRGALAQGVAGLPSSAWKTIPLVSILTVFDTACLPRHVSNGPAQRFHRPPR